MGDENRSVDVSVVEFEPKTACVEISKMIVAIIGDDWS